MLNGWLMIVMLFDFVGLILFFVNVVKSLGWLL